MVVKAKAPARRAQAKRARDKGAPPRRRGTVPAMVDDLTELPSGPAAVASAATTFQESLALGHAASLAVIDLDEMRGLNRTLGTERADAVLKVVAKRLAAALPAGASALRLAGDCFLAVLPGLEPEEALLALQTVRAAVARPTVVGRAATRREAHPTVSVGVASGPHDGDGFVPVLARAQSALRRAKALGRDRVASPAEDRMVLKTSYYTQSQLERLKALAQSLGVAEATILREAVEDVLLKHKARRPPTEA